MAFFGSRSVHTTLKRHSVAAILIGSVSGCETITETLYGDRGIKPQVQADQEVSVRKVDLVFLLDPAGKRLNPDLDGDTELDRAYAVFSDADNNGNPTPVPNCSITGRDEQLVGRRVVFTETTVTTAVRDVTVTIDEAGKQNTRKVGQPRTTKTDTSLAFRQGPKINPITLCPVQSEMKRRRNAIIARLMQASDVQCARYLTALEQFESDIEFGSSLVSLGLGIAGGIAEGVAASIAPAAGAAGGLSGAFSESYLAGRTVTAIQTAIETERSRIFKEAIGPKLQQPPATYPVESAVRDALRYHYACSLRTGAEKVVEAVNKEKKAVEAKPAPEMPTAEGAAPPDGGGGGAQG